GRGSTRPVAAVNPYRLSGFFGPHRHHPRVGARVVHWAGGRRWCNGRVVCVRTNGVGTPGRADGRRLFGPPHRRGTTVAREFGDPGADNSRACRRARRGGTGVIVGTRLGPVGTIVDVEPPAVAGHGGDR